VQTSVPHESDLDRLVAPDHAIAAFEVRTVELEGADWASELQITPRVCNSSGVLQGGLLATMMDIAAGNALLHGPEPYDQTTTMDLHVSYHAGVRVGPARFAAFVLRRGGRSASVRVEVHDLGAGALHCATGLLTFAARHLPPEEMHKSPKRLLAGEEGADQA
jgi:acyl-coenzyme A thioesterase PaaI-like protein